jgi:hypothetical protein
LGFFFSQPPLNTGQLLIIVLVRNTAEFGVTIAAIPVVLVLLALCGTAVQREIKWYVEFSPRTARHLIRFGIIQG